MDDNKAIDQYKIPELDRLYTEGEECDKRIFAEMRTNLQLVAGEHYVREGSRAWTRIREDKQLTDAQRLKLTKNHLQRITKIYRNEIESFSPDVAIVPANENELADQKSAQLNYSYWQYVKDCENVPSKVHTWIKNYCEIGEVACKVFWELDAGNIIGYEAEMTPDPMGSGQMVPAKHPLTGELVQSNRPVYGGKIKYETIEGYNIRRDPSARSMDESSYLLITKLMSKRALKTLFTDPELIRKLEQESPTLEYTVYDNNTGYYRTAKDQILVKECYWRPAKSIPKGYYYIWTSFNIIAQGELPYGIFPICHAGFDEQTGNPRSHSIIRHCRPAQIEINRCASKIAEHQVTLADDKVWVPATTKLTQGSMLPGIRVNMYSGMKPEITPGRTGDQFLPYLESQINELYVLANLSEILEKQPEGTDLYTNLMRSYRFKKKFAIYGQKFERFLIDVVKTTLSIAKQSANENDLIPAFGKSEYINIPEFKNTQDIHYQIRIQPRSDDIESQFGKQLQINTVLQYVGANLEKEDIGQMLRLSPFMNKEQMFKKFTQKYDRLANDLLALDRGQWRPPQKYDDHAYIIDGLATRMSEPDFERLSPQIQQMYDQKMAMHEQAKTQQLLEIQHAQSGFIPSGGYLVKCDFYIQSDPKNPNSTKRVSIPSESLNWLIEKLQVQGTNLDEIEKMPKGVLQDIGGMMGNDNARLAQALSNLGGPNAN